MLSDVLVVELPPVFEQLGIGGILSPQHLLETEYVALDGPGKRLVLLEGSADAVVAWLQLSNATREVHQVKAQRQMPGLLHLAVSVDALDPVATLVDTGGSDSEFLVSYLGKPTGPEVAGGVSAGGKQMVATASEKRTVRFGDLKVGPITLQGKPALSDPYHQGILGFNALRTLTVAIPNGAGLVMVFARP